MSKVPLYIFLESTKVLVSPPTPWPSEGCLYKYGQTVSCISTDGEMRVFVQIERCVYKYGPGPCVRVLVQSAERCVH